MSRKCAACTHPDSADINAQLAEGGTSIRGLSRKFLLSEDSLQRHKKRHLPQAVAQAAEKKGAEKGADLLDRIKSAEAKLSGYEKIAYSLAQKGFRLGDDALVLKALSEARRSAVESRLRLWNLELQVTETREIAARLEDVERQIGADQWVR